MFRKIAVFLLDLFFPTFCCSCKKIGPYLCNQCYEELHFLPTSVKIKIQPQHLDELIAAVSYRPPIDALIQFMKYQHVRNITAYCGQLLYRTTNFPCADVVTSIPLDHRRQADRGYDQSALTAQEFSRASHIPYRLMLHRVKKVAHQSSLKNREQRLTNLHDVFALLPNVTMPKHVLLIDDVATTGTTLNECAKILKEHGAEWVTGLVVAHGS